jgi:hypothetical protein
MRRGEAEIGPATIPQAEQLIPVGVPAPGPLPDVARMEHRQQELLPAEAVHLLPDDALDLQADALSEGEQRVGARHELSHEARAQQQAMAGGLCIRGIVTQGGNERLGPAHAATSGATLTDTARGITRPRRGRLHG